MSAYDHLYLPLDQAAELLNTAPEHVASLLDAGEIKFRTDGDGRVQVLTSSLERYKEQDDEHRRSAADELTRLSQDMGLY
jgi:hypothetical protein